MPQIRMGGDNIYEWGNNIMETCIITPCQVELAQVGLGGGY